MPSFTQRIAGEIKSFSTDGWVAPKLAKRMDKFMQYLIVAGKKALENGGITEDVMNELDKSRCGVLIGSAMGGMKVWILQCIFYFQKRQHFYTVSLVHLMILF
jgi:3-oxoacyl-[acyl-carrier-protein] synthase II